MAEFISQFQDKVKTSTGNLGLMLLKLLTGALIGLTLALIFQELIGYGTISFVLVIAVVTLTLFRIMKTWTWSRLLIFDLICVLVALLLRMYIKIGRAHV